MKAAIYARVSGHEQRKAGTIAPQLDVLHAWCATMGWPVVAVFIDDGVSAKAGNLANRHDLLKMLDLATGRGFDVLVVLDIDRLTRSKDLIERSLIIGTVQRAGIKLGSPSTGVLDPDTFAGDITIGVKAAASAEWLRQHIDRIKRGKASAIARNRKPAGPSPYGWTYSRATGTWAVHPAQAAVVREVLRRVAGGETCHELARDLTRRAVPRPRGGTWWHPEKVWSIARSTQWTGAWLADKRKGLALALPPIATVEACEAAAAALARHRRHAGPRARHVYLLERIATCGLCGARVGIASAEPSGNIRATYVCTHRRRPVSGPPCTLHRHPIEVADAEVWAGLVDAIASERMAAVLLGRESARGRTSDAEIEAARGRLAQVTRARTVALSHHAGGLIDDLALARHLRDLADRERDARVAVTAAEASRGTGYPEDPRSVAEALAALQAVCAAADATRRREIVRRLAGAVTIANHRIEVRLRLPAEWIRSSNRDRAGSNSERLAGRLVVLVPGGRDVPLHRRRTA